MFHVKQYIPLNCETNGYIFFVYAQQLFPIPTGAEQGKLYGGGGAKYIFRDLLESLCQGVMRHFGTFKGPKIGA